MFIPKILGFQKMNNNSKGEKNGLYNNEHAMTGSSEISTEINSSCIYRCNCWYIFIIYNQLSIMWDWIVFPHLLLELVNKFP